MKIEMKNFLLFAFASSILCIAIANDILTGGLQLQEPCFPVFDCPQCNETLLESYQPENPIIGANAPDTKVFLFTRTNPDTAEQLHLYGGKLPPNSTYDPEAYTEIFCHGWLDGVCKTAWLREMKEQLFIRGNYNCIIIDWSWGNTIDYYSASQNCKVVGEQIGFVINNIMQQTGVSGKKFHIIGHSYGAVAGGFAGRKLKELNNTEQLRRVTGLDPAFPAEKDEPLNQTLTYKDAEIVDIIHTNGGQCHLFYIGDSRPLGHADFYVEGGEWQTSCYSAMLEAYLKLDLFAAVTSLSPTLCSHVQAHELYKVSINPDCEFIGVECDSYENLKNCVRSGQSETAVMGMNFEKYYQPSNKRPRKYYLHVKDVCSYADNRYLEEGNYPSNLTCEGEPKL